MRRIEILVIWLARPMPITVLLGLYMLFVAVIFPSQTNAGAPPIDLAFHYSVEEVYGWIESYGEAGRKHYMIGELTLDLVYPLIYTALFIGLLGYFQNYRASRSFLVYLPIAIWAFDLLENLGIVLMLANYPRQLDELARVTSWFTTFKWTSAGIVILITLVCALIFVVNTAKRRLTK